MKKLKNRLMKWLRARCEACGHKPPNAWIKWMEERKISWVKWSISAKNETCSMLPAGAATTGGWPAETLKPSGAYTRKLLRQLNNP